MKKSILFVASLAISLAASVPVYAEVSTMPDVSEEMLDPDYWIKDHKEADKVLADFDTIDRLNSSFLACESCNMNDLASVDKSFDGSTANLDRWKSSLTELAGYLDGNHYDVSGNVISGNYVMEILGNLNDRDAAENEEIRYGICVRRSDVRAYPTDLIIADDPGDNDFDNVQISAVRLGEPVIIQGTSEDGGFYCCKTSCVSGWIPSEDIAICKDKTEWLNAWDFPEDEAMVVTSSKVRLEDSNTSPELSGLIMTMGTVLRKVDPDEYEDNITNRSVYYNHPVWIPGRNEDGMYERHQALVSVHNGISDGFLPLTTKNILEQSYQMLGDAYGWGGMLSSSDCSSYVRDVYKCFGLELPRNTNWQAAMPVEKYDLSIAEEADKKGLLDELPAGTLLFFKGHEMIYLGQEDGKYYVISSTSSMMEPEGEEKARIRSVIINTLDAKRANGNTWIGDIYEAALPYIENEKNLSKPVFSSADETVSENTVSDNSVSDNSVSDNSVSDNSVSDNSVSDNSVSDNRVSGNSVSDNSVPDKSVSDNSVSDNSVSDNSVSDNSVSDNSVSDNSVSDNAAPDDSVSDKKAADESADENSGYKEIAFDKTWEYAENAKITDGKARLYQSDAPDRNGLTICVNAGHGTEGGGDVKVPCHPDGSPKIVSGSTSEGATESVAITAGTTMENGDPESEATLKAAIAVKEELLKNGYDVLMIRETDDVQLDNIARSLIADHYADAHIALHYDSTDTDKGVFYCSVPEDEDYLNMEPVKSCWKEHEKLGKSLIYGLQDYGFKTWNNGSFDMDLTQTSYSTIPSVDLEIGDTVTDYSDKTLDKTAEGIVEGLDIYFNR